MARWITPLAMALSLSLTAGFNAFACSPPPPADWEGWIADGTTDIFVGRVTSLTPLPDAEVHGIPLRQARLRITRLSSYEDRTGPAVIDATIVLEVPDPAREADAHALCLYPAPYRAGDVLLVIQQPGDIPRLFSRAWVGESRFTPLFQASQDIDQ
ncbi:hypothetical protein [Brevundimonas sp.]|uniref:hypothetical protein n=1 Tax=Brevundimonas sp. TaxID=1871086 RepID=UPI001D99FAF1|nr:hypothetical protein [Brevundimonas sp.]MBL0948706.1 hypothetical protein [Brevundimonas sp.]